MHISNKGLVSRVDIKNSFKTNQNNQPNSQIEKWAQDITRQFKEKEPQVASKHMRRFFQIIVLKTIKVKKNETAFCTHQVGGKNNV